ncbi:hypothetical protein ACWF2L_24135 [Streptomyces anulatus]
MFGVLPGHVSPSAVEDGDVPGVPGHTQSMEAGSPQVHVDGRAVDRVRAEIQHQIDEQRAAERRRAFVNRDLPLLADYDDGFDLGWDNPPSPPPGGSR